MDEHARVMALGLLDLIEELMLENVCLRTVLKLETEDAVAWESQVETLKILNAHKVREHIHKLRLLVAPNPDENPQQSDPDSIVRRILDTVRSRD